MASSSVTVMTNINTPFHVHNNPPHLTVDSLQGYNPGYISDNHTDSYPAGGAAVMGLITGEVRPQAALIPS